jgi:hypothetical protein
MKFMSSNTRELRTRKDQKMANTVNTVKYLSKEKQTIASDVTIALHLSTTIVALWLDVWEEAISYFSTHLSLQPIYSTWVLLF